MLPDRAAPIAEEAAPEKVIPIRPVPSDGLIPDVRMHVPAPLLTARTLSLQSQPAQPVNRIRRERCQMPLQSPGPRAPKPLLALRLMRQTNPE